MPVTSVTCPHAGVPEHEGDNALYQQACRIHRTGLSGTLNSKLGIQLKIYIMMSRRSNWILTNSNS
jgi:hypothetical protein